MNEKHLNSEISNILEVAQLQPFRFKASSQSLLQFLSKFNIYSFLR